MLNFFGAVVLSAVLVATVLGQGGQPPGSNVLHSGLAKLYLVLLAQPGIRLASAPGPSRIQRPLKAF
jgi:hypothetical protein